MYSADIMNIRLPKGGVRALSVEAGQLRLLPGPWEKEAVPERPAVVVIDLKMPEVREMRSPAARLKDAVMELLRGGRGASWMVEAHRPEEFTKYYQDLISNVKPDQSLPVLVYAPFVKGKAFEFSRDELLKMRDMLDAMEGWWPNASAEDDDVVDLAVGDVAVADVDSKDIDDEGSKRETLEGARRRRAHLLKEVQWLDAVSVHEQQGGHRAAPGAVNTSSRLRRKGELLGAWDGREYRHPAFQFDRQTGRLMPEMKDLLDVLPKDKGGWRQMFWMYQPHALLDRKRPADVFQSDPRAVIEAARSTFEPGDTNW